MGVAIGDVLPMALGVAVSPIQIIAAILILFSPRAKSVAPAFLLGWLVGLCITGGLTLLIADPIGDDGADDGPSTLLALVQLALGVLFLLFALKKWKGRPQQGDTSEMPTWMAGIDTFSPAKGMAVGAALAGLNPKILIFTIAAGVTIIQDGAGGASALAALAVFIVLGSSTVIVPVVWYLLAPQRATPVLETWRVWLVANNAAVLAVILLVFGVLLLGKGISGLSA